MEDENKSWYVTLESDLIFDCRINSTTKILYAIISSYSNNKNGFCYLNHKKLMELVNLKKRQFYYCLNDLKKYKYISTKKINNRVYLMPVINILIENRLSEPNVEKKEIYEYDWLNNLENN